MGRLGVILGSSATGPSGAEVVAAVERHGAVALQRHGTGAYVLPHLIDHAANLRALAEAGCDRVLAICSVGSLHGEFEVGSFVCPHDFIALQITVTTLNDARAHAMPGFDTAWRERVVAAWEAWGTTMLHDGAAYWQTNGPRFETPAEITLMTGHADVVGMTMASECIVAGELGLPYAAICVVDNMANGVGTEPLSPAELERDRAANVPRLREALDELLPELVD
jgi:5'-methylthioadenosine phosphorylase